MSKYRGWKYRCYADELETPVADVVWAVIGGAIGFYMFPGWIFVSTGILSLPWVGALCMAAGLALGGRILYEQKKDKEES